MFLGHFGVALGSRPVAPRVSLGTLFLAAQFLDLLWPVLVLTGVETVRIVPGITRVTPLDFVNYPYSHSLAAAVFWSLVVGGIYGAVRQWARGAAVVGGLVFSHWVLDFITHRPDLPIAPGLSARVGLGLWNSLSGTLLAEALLFLGARRSTSGSRSPATGSGRLEPAPCSWPWSGSLWRARSARRHPAPRPSPGPGWGCGCSSRGRTGSAGTAARGRPSGPRLSSSHTAQSRGPGVSQVSGPSGDPRRRSAGYWK